MTGQATHIVCPHCLATNRIPLDKPAKAARCGRCRRPLFEGRPIDVDDAQLEKHIQGNEIPVVVDFWAPWCGPCRVMASAYAQAAAALEPAVRLLKLNTEGNPQAAQRFGIQAVPTLIMFRHGKVAARMSGAMDERGLRQWITSHATQS